MWNLKCTIVAVIVGATELVKSSLRKNLEAVIGTSHVLRKVLQC